jgi:hypothetical protein
MEKIAIALFPDREKAEQLSQRLTEAGLKPEIHKHELLLEKLWHVHKSHPVRVEVPSNQFELAEELVCHWDAQGGLADAIHCPECGSLRVQYPQFAHKAVIPNILVGVLATFGAEKDFYCEDCHYTWPKEGSKISPSRPHGAPYYFIEGVPQRKAPAPEERKAA